MTARSRAAFTLAALADRPIWVAWRTEIRNGKRTKVPYDPRTGRRAASNNPSTWATHDEAVQWAAAKRADGVSLMFCPIDDVFLAGIDLDTCRDLDSGDVADWAREVIDRFDSYSEVSPSSTGVKVFFTIAAADTTTAAEALFDGKQGRKFTNGHGGEHPPAIEVYIGGRFFAVTNEAIGPTDELRLVSVDDLRWLICEAGPRFADKGKANSGNGQDASRSAKAFRAGAMLRAAGKSYEQMRSALLAHEDSGIAERARTKGRLICEAGPRFADKGKANSGNGQDASRSAKAFRAGAMLRAAGKSYEQMRSALLAHEDSGIAEWARTKGLDNGERELRRIYDKTDCGDEPAVTIEDFVAYMQSHDYIFMPAGDFWPAGRVDARLPPVRLFDKSGLPIVDAKTGEQKEIRASAWLAKHAPVEQMTWAPGLPQLVRHRLISDGGWTERPNVTVFNLYRPPRPQSGDAAKAGPWIAHVKRIYPDDAAHIIAYLAHQVQKPEEKINHGLLLGGGQGIGKDTLLEPVKRAVGPWNFHEVSPQQALGSFNGFLKSVVLRISEAKDMGEYDRYKFYHHMKTYMAAPPDVLRVNEKNLREHSVFNVLAVIITTNLKVDGIYLPADDRRHYVAWSAAKKEDEKYWRDLWGWYEREGFAHVAAYLAAYDLSSFNPKAPPPKTPTFWEIVDASRAPEVAELADVIDELGNPDAVTLARLRLKASGTEIGEWLADRKNRRAIPHRLEQCGYVPVRNDGAYDGLFKIEDRRQVVYARETLSIRDRIAAANELCG